MNQAKPAVVLIDLETGRLTWPVAAYLTECAERRAWQIDGCPHCGNHHSHPAGKHGEDPNRYLGVVRAKCGGEYPIMTWYDLARAGALEASLRAWWKFSPHE